MNGRSIAGKMAAVTATSIGALAMVVATATAAPNPANDGIDNLTKLAGDDVSAKAGVSAIASFTNLVGADRLRTVSAQFVPFSYAAPTFGCGSNGPITTVIAAATFEGPGPRTPTSLTPGDLRFSASPMQSGFALASGLNVAWVNLNTGLSGIVALDDQTEFRTPSLSKTVHSGAGTVVASMWGSIDYPGQRCVMTPTVGTFVVPDLPVQAPVAPGEPAPTTTTPAPVPGLGSGEAVRPQATEAAPAPAPVAPPAPTTTQPPSALTVGG
ncbi:hypothetical protein [Nocardia camponoti]|uniref:Secreted protein n=1 Tax=Nocardia camponoti TaxID=1616106 RepID=A0A917V7N8_9NOCA|nr:hypothetical protein [Nocardia camponoti]GGK46848.1 hypothetical protein GCM10011591_17730 [Nocardia camponoti]